MSVDTDVTLQVIDTMLTGHAKYRTECLAANELAVAEFWEQQIDTLLAERFKLTDGTP